MSELKDKLNDRERIAMGAEPPITKTEFTERMWSLRPLGDPSSAYIEVGYAIMFKRTFDGAKITFDMLVTKYTQYLEHCKAEHRQEKYIAGISGWMRRDLFNESVVSPSIQKRIEQYTKGNNSDGNKGA